MAAYPLKACRQPAGEWDDPVVDWSGLDQVFVERDEWEDDEIPFRSVEAHGEVCPGVLMAGPGFS